MSVTLNRTMPAEPSSAHLRMSNAGTLPRFILLIVLFVGVTAVITGSLVDARADPDAMAVGCGLASGGNPDLSDLDVRLRTADQTSAYRECRDRFVPEQAWWWKPGALLLVSLCAVALYWMLPLWKGRRSRVVPVEKVDDSAELSTILAELVAVAGLKRPPRFVIAPAVPTTGAVVFGRLGRYTVCLDGGLVARRHGDPEGFRSVVLHELAHLRNRDVDITYAAVALWRILLGVILPLDLMYAVVVSLPDTAGTYMESREQTRVAHHVAMLAVTLVLAYLARADILRTREYHADLTARRWGVDVRIWERAAAQEVTERAAPRSATRWLRASVTRLLRAHPTWQQRLGSMANSATMLTPRVLPFFLTGATAAIAATRLPGLLTLLGATSRQVPLIVAVVVAVLVTAITGLLLWPAVTHAARTSGPARSSGLRAGCGLAAGLIVGELAVGRSGNIWEVLPELPMILVLPALAGLAATWWTSEYAEVSALRPEGARRRLPLLVGLGVSCLVMAVWWHWWENDGSLLAGVFNAFGDNLYSEFEQDVTSGQGYQGPLLALAPGLPVLLVMSMRVELIWMAALLCGTAILAWLPRLDSAGRPWPVLPAAGIGALCSTVLVVAATAGLRVWSPVVAGQEQSHLVAYLMWLMVVILAVMFVAAGLVAALADRSPLMQSLVVSGATGLAGLAAMAVLASFDGCVRPLVIQASSCQVDPLGGWAATALLIPTTLGLGLFLSVAVAALGVLARRPLRRFRDRAMSTRRAGNGRLRRGRRTLRRAAVLTPCLVAAALTITMTVDARSGSSTAALAAPRYFVLTDQPTSSTVRAAQVNAWLVLGGAERMSQVFDGMVDLVKRLDQLNADGSSRAFNDWSVIEAEMRPRCVAIAGRVANARRYFDYPEPRYRSAWDELLARAERAVGDCELAIGQRNRGDYLAALDELLRVGLDLSELGRAMIR